MLSENILKYNNEYEDFIPPNCKLNIHEKIDSIHFSATYRQLTHLQTAYTFRSIDYNDCTAIKSRVKQFNRELYPYKITAVKRAVQCSKLLLFKTNKNSYRYAKVELLGLATYTHTPPTLSQTKKLFEIAKIDSLDICIDTKDRDTRHLLQSPDYRGYRGDFYTIRNTFIQKYICYNKQAKNNLQSPCIRHEATIKIDNFEDGLIELRDLVTENSTKQKDTTYTTPNRNSKNIPYKATQSPIKQLQKIDKVKAPTLTQTPLKQPFIDRLLLPTKPYTTAPP